MSPLFRSHLFLVLTEQCGTFPVHRAEQLAPCRPSSTSLLMQGHRCIPWQLSRYANLSVPCSLATHEGRHKLIYIQLTNTTIKFFLDLTSPNSIE
ncbi:hypothetical protein CPB85DRAFT_781717 [Mucidula mucida]|nr:hypothetical protein CPB85DRAFT_781717 [Mucidula mucida]